jgi:predicted ABC-type transport system involved in lysophospholipase L1 biosynthesis ATPase subunit
MERDLNERKPLLRADTLGKTYRLPHKTVEVLRGASFAVQPGERVAIVGRSGAGKSTLLHLLGGLDRPDAGEVLLNGLSLYTLPPRKRTRLRAQTIGLVFQAYHLLPEMDVTENVLLPAMALSRLNRATLRMRALELLAQVGLADRATHMPLELSGGEQQRVAIARALMNAPELLLADEPTGNLDRDTGRQTLDLLFGLAQQSGHALVIVTHDTEVAARCGRVLELEGGVMHPR